MAKRIAPPESVRPGAQREYILAASSAYVGARLRANLPTRHDSTSMGRNSTAYCAGLKLESNLSTYTIPE
jgi:hypothetical protein